MSGDGVVVDICVAITLTVVNAASEDAVRCRSAVVKPLCAWADATKETLTVEAVE